MNENDIIKDLEIAKAVLCNPSLINIDMCIKIGQAISNAIELLKKQRSVTADELL